MNDTLERLAPETLAAMRADCADFLGLIDREGINRGDYL